MTDDFPENWLKGVRKQGFIFGDSVFGFVFKPQGDSINGWRESSINWEFDQGAVENLLVRKSNDQALYEGCVVRVPTSALNRIINHFKIIEEFRYEPKPEDNNRYHGNLLFADSLKGAERDTVCGALANSVINLIPPEN